MLKRGEGVLRADNRRSDGTRGDAVVYPLLSQDLAHTRFRHSLLASKPSFCDKSCILPNGMTRE